MPLPKSPMRPPVPPAWTRPVPGAGLAAAGHPENHGSVVPVRRGLTCDLDGRVDRRRSARSAPRIEGVHADGRAPNRTGRFVASDEDPVDVPEVALAGVVVAV